MRRMIWFPIGALLALVLVFVACSDEDSTQEQVQQQTQPDAAAQTTAQRSQEQAQSATAGAESDSREAQSSADDAEAQPQEDSGDGEPSSATSDESESGAEDAIQRAAFEAADKWSEHVEQMSMTASISVPILGQELEYQAEIALRLDPLLVLMSVDLSPLMTMFRANQDESEGEPEGELLMRLLLSEDGVYVNVSQLDGWIDMTDELGVGDLGDLIGLDPEEFADPTAFMQAFECLDVAGGTVESGSYAGELVWDLNCEVDLDELPAAISLLGDSAQGMDLESIRGLRMRLQISQASGAPLLTETAVILSGLLLGAEDGEDVEVLTVTELTSWNEPIDFPTPEPLIEGSLEDLLGGGQAEAQEPPPLPTTGQLLERAAVWLLTVDELHADLDQQMSATGEVHRVKTTIAGSRSRGAFETATSIDDDAFFGLLWTRNGLWTSEGANFGQVWQEVTPSLLGFEQESVDDLLAEPLLLDISGYRRLSEFASVSRLIEGGNPAMYEFAIETGGDVEGNPHIQAIVDLLKAEHAELFAADLEISVVDRFFTKLSFVGEEMALLSRETMAELITSEGETLSLESTLKIDATTAPSFSEPDSETGSEPAQ